MNRLIFVLALIVAPMFARGQVRELSLHTAIELAIGNNRELEISRLDVEKADHQVSEAIGSALPSISLNGDYTRALKKPVFFLPDFQNQGSDRIIPIEIGSTNSLLFGVRANQVLFNAVVFTGVGTAKIYQEASREQYRNAYNVTIAKVKRAYFGVLYVQDVADMVKASLANAEENLKNVQAFNRQGVVSDYDLIRAQVQTENIRPGVVEAERNVLVLQNTLKVILGLSPDEAIRLTDSLSFQTTESSVLENAETTLREQNAGLKALELLTQVNEQIVKLYRFESLPTISAFGNYLWQSQRNDFNFSTNDFIGSSQVGLSLNVNLFNGFQTSSRVNQAEVDFLKSREQLSSTTDALRSQIQNIRLRLEEARRRVEAQGKTVEQAEKGYKIANARYAAGAGTQLEINDADVALMRARVNRVQAVYDYNVAQTDLEELLCLSSPVLGKQ